MPDGHSDMIRKHVLGAILIVCPPIHPPLAWDEPLHGDTLRRGTNEVLFSRRDFCKWRIQGRENRVDCVGVQELLEGVHIVIWRCETVHI